MLLKVKLLIAKPFYFFIKGFHFNQFKKFLKKNKARQKLHIFDLDNTLADTYPSLNNPDKIKMYQELPIHESMVNIVNKEINKNELCIILSARDYKYKNPTRLWMNKHLSKKDIPFFLVPSAKDKLPYLEKATVSFREVVYYDDLSYNHENGKVKLYSDIINKVRSMPIKYFGHEGINKINY
jgi:hypothetical protein